MAGSTADAVSLKRAIRLLEVFEAERRPLTSREIGEAVAAPRSSTAGLLKALIALRVLSLDRRSKSYLPTPRLSGLTFWIEEAWSPTPIIRDHLAALQAATGLNVVLASPLDLDMEILHTSNGIPHPGARRRGMICSMDSCASGLMYLSTLPHSSLARMIQRLAEREGSRSCEIKRLLACLRDVRRVGAAELQHGDGWASIALALPSGAALRPLIIEVEGPRDRIRSEEAELLARLRGLAKTATDSLSPQA